MGGPWQPTFYWKVDYSKHSCYTILLAIYLPGPGNTLIKAWCSISESGKWNFESSLPLSIIYHLQLQTNLQSLKKQEICPTKLVYYKWPKEITKYRVDEPDTVLLAVALLKALFVNNDRHSMIINMIHGANLINYCRFFMVKLGRSRCSLRILRLG